MKNRGTARLLWRESRNRAVTGRAVSRSTRRPYGYPAQAVSGLTLGKHEQKVEWRTEPRTLREWRAGDGALLDDALRTGCDALAAQIANEAERMWRNR